MSKRSTEILIWLVFTLGICAVGTAVNSAAPAKPTESAPAESATAVLDPHLSTSLEPMVDMEAGWRDPPAIARTRCWWWWLNGNVTKEAITRDLEEMKAKGLGGANIIDAGGANQRGNRQVPHGPDFGSVAWRELFVHALKEADRLGLELGLNIQSGWNLGGPTVRPEQAAKKLTWSEMTIAGGSPVNLKLPQPPAVDDFYRDVATLAVPANINGGNGGGFEVSAERSQSDHPPRLALDGDPNTFWVSGTQNPGDGPSVERPVRLEFEFTEPTKISQIVIYPREDYGPKRGWVQSAASPRNWHVLGRWSADATGKTIINFPQTTAKRFRLVIVDSYDPRSPVMPRNVQIAEIELRNDGNLLQGGAANVARVQNIEQKAYYVYPGPFTATKADHLLGDVGGEPGERIFQPDEILNISEHVAVDGQLTWDPPPGNWKILRFGYTLSGSHVSTSSDGWSGYAIDYLDRAAFDKYWDDVLQPLLDVARPYVGRSLRYLHTDSWELGPVNWTPALPAQFLRLQGYEITPYLPVLAGYVVESRDGSNRFLNDFRRTLAEGIAAGKYGRFHEAAHRAGLGLHPESGGPHAAPIDALLCLGRSDIPMGEFWARSPTHRIQDHERFFTKQPASAAHIYGKRLVMAEAFTSIGPQWEESPRDLKPVFDQAACEGLNLVMLHTFDCSPASMGLPGQAYFAGSHINPNVTWWRHAGAFFDYLNRCQFLLQQGLPAADVLYFYGENVPSFVRLKAEDPAGVLPGYDYDVINREALLARAKVSDGQIVLPDGTKYRLLVLPAGDCYSLDVLRKIEELVAAGAAVVGPKPGGPIGLSSDPQGDAAFRALADRLWQENAGEGVPVVRDVAARAALGHANLGADFQIEGAESRPEEIDFIHRRTADADIYFVANRTEHSKAIDASFRVAGKQPELWDAVSGEIRDAQAFRQTDGRTVVPLQLAPGGSIFVVFRKEISAAKNGAAAHNEPQLTQWRSIDGPWQVEFDRLKGGPEQPQTFERLVSWSDLSDPQVKYYSGTAIYRTAFDVGESDVEQPAAAEQPSPGKPRRTWLSLGDVKNVANVRLNGSPLRVVWTDPLRVEVTDHLRSGANELEIEVTNLWPNRLIGDQRLPPDDRITNTNITKFQGNSPLLLSGLLGPVSLLIEKR
jgi:hypothetical protein